MIRLTCGDYARVLFYFAREAAGAAVHPAFLAPSVYEGVLSRIIRARFAPRRCGGVAV